VINKTENPSKVENFLESKMLYGEIIQGYSRILIPENGEDKEEIIFFKHPTEVDNAKLLITISEYEEQGIRKGLKREKDKLKDLAEADVWSENDEKEVKEIRSAILFGEKQKAKLALQAQRDTMQADIDHKQKLLDEKSKMRTELLDLTAELYATKKVNKNVVMDSLFKDEKFKKPLVTEEDIEESDEIIWKYSYCMSTQQGWFSDSNFKKISIWPFFLNSFFMLGDDVSNFYRKPLAELTTYQVELLSAGRWIKGILTQTDKSPPEDLYDNLDKLINWYYVEQANIVRKSKSKPNKPNHGSQRKSHIGGAR